MVFTLYLERRVGSGSRQEVGAVGGGGGCLLPAACCLLFALALPVHAVDARVHGCTRIAAMLALVVCLSLTLSHSSTPPDC